MDIKSISIWKGSEVKPVEKEPEKPKPIMHCVKVNNTYSKHIVYATDMYRFVNGRRYTTYEDFNFVTTEYERFDKNLISVFVKNIRDLPQNDERYYQYYDDQYEKYVPYYGLAILDNESIAPIFNYGIHTLFPFIPLKYTNPLEDGKRIPHKRRSSETYTFLENRNKNLNDLKLISLYNNQIMERARKTKKEEYADYIIRVFFRLNYGQFDTPRVGETGLLEEII